MQLEPLMHGAGPDEDELAAIRLLWREDTRPALEVGVGPGRFTQALGVEFGIDPAVGALRFAERRGIQVKQAKEGGFCGVRVQPDCPGIDSNGTVCVSLSAAAPAWFEALAELGEVLHLTRNPVAVLGRLDQMPVMQDRRNAVLLRDRGGLFTPNLAEYAGLWAVREVSPLGVLHGLEVREVSGMVFERIGLPAGAHRELFKLFVTLHQSPPE